MQFICTAIMESKALNKFINQSYQILYNYIKPVLEQTERTQAKLKGSFWFLH